MTSFKSSINFLRRFIISVPYLINCSSHESRVSFKYGLSIGPAIVRQGYEGGRESAFNEYLESLTLKGDRKTTYSDTVTAGRIVSYNYGKYSK